MVKKLCSDWLLLLFWFWFFKTPLKTAIIILIIANSYLAFIAGVLSDAPWIKRRLKSTKTKSRNLFFITFFTCPPLKTILICS